MKTIANKKTRGVLRALSCSLLAAGLHGISALPAYAQTSMPAEFQASLLKDDLMASVLREILPELADWRQSWTQRDVPRYLGHYAADFRPERGITHAAWQRQRQKRLTEKEFVSLALGEFQVSLKEDGRARVRFEQDYRSGGYRDRVWKELTMIRSGDRWLIQRERVLRILPTSGGDLADQLQPLLGVMQEDMTRTLQVAPPVVEAAPVITAAPTPAPQPAPPPAPLPKIMASPEARRIEHDASLFRLDPSYDLHAYDVDKQLEIYGGKRAVTTPRALLEWGRDIYTTGPFEPAGTGLGELNPTNHRLYVYGDMRTAVAYNDNGATEVGQLATRLNLDIDYKFTATERFHALVQPLDRDGAFPRCEFSGGDSADECKADANIDPETLFFEGDIGAITAGITGKPSSFDLPVAVGLMPLVLQNGIWMADAFTGVAMTAPAMNSATLDISNMDITAFVGLEDVSSNGIRDAAGKVPDDDVRLYGVTAFIEANQGYWELGYGFTDGQDEFDDQDYHNLAVGFTRRYLGRLSNSIRLIWNFGQNPKAGAQNADGVLLLVENSLITANPSTVVPYLNLFAGIDRPQSLARAAGAGGVLANTGILFESDALTGYPTMDATAQDTFGAALGIEYLFALDQQLVLEVAALGVRGDDLGRPAKGKQFGLGLRYQRPLTRAWLMRTDAMWADRENDENLAGVRFELRRKF